MDKYAALRAVRPFRAAPFCPIPRGEVPFFLSAPSPSLRPARPREERVGAWASFGQDWRLSAHPLSRGTVGTVGSPVTLRERSNLCVLIRKILLRMRRQPRRVARALDFHVARFGSSFLRCIRPRSGRQLDHLAGQSPRVDQSFLPLRPVLLSFFLFFFNISFRVAGLRVVIKCRKLNWTERHCLRACTKV